MSLGQGVVGFVRFGDDNDDRRLPRGRVVSECDTGVEDGREGVFDVVPVEE